MFVSKESHSGTSNSSSRDDLTGSERAKRVMKKGLGDPTAMRLGLEEMAVETRMKTTLHVTRVHDMCNRAAVHQHVRLSQSSNDCQRRSRITCGCDP